MRPPPRFRVGKGQTTRLEIDMLPPNTDALPDTKPRDCGKANCGNGGVTVLRILQRIGRGREFYRQQNSIPRLFAGALDSGPTPIRWTVEGCRHRHWGER